MQSISPFSCCEKQQPNLYDNLAYDYAVHLDIQLLLKQQQPNLNINLAYDYAVHLTIHFIFIYFILSSTSLWGVYWETAIHHYNISLGQRKLQVGSKEQQTNHSQRFLILFLLFFWMVHARGRWYCLSLFLALSHPSGFFSRSLTQSYIDV